MNKKALKRIDNILPYVRQVIVTGEGSLISNVQFDIVLRDKNTVSYKKGHLNFYGYIGPQPWYPKCRKPSSIILETLKESRAAKRNLDKYRFYLHYVIDTAMWWNRKYVKFMVIDVEML